MDFAKSSPLVALVCQLADGDHVYFDSTSAACSRKFRLHHRRKDRDYVSITVEGKNYYVHRLMMMAGPHERIHHKDANPLNWCRDNLVIVSPKQNARIRRKPPLWLGRY